MGLEPQNVNKKETMTSKCQQTMEKGRLHSATHHFKPTLRGKKHNYALVFKLDMHAKFQTFNNEQHRIVNK